VSPPSSDGGSPATEELTGDAWHDHTRLHAYVLVMFRAPMYLQLLYVVDIHFNYPIHIGVGHAYAGCAAGQVSSTLSQPKSPEMALYDGALDPVTSWDSPRSPGLAGTSLFC
jgi:hypothetical protein